MSDLQATEETQPFHLQGNFAPVDVELNADNLSVTGKLPADLTGIYMRNGPNPASGVSVHWFAGDGMLHGIRLDGGQASWYRNRWVKTKRLSGEGVYLQEDASVDRTVGVANTNIIRHHGKILALVENAFPTVITGTLETAGVYDFGGRLTSSMTAHPKECPITGDLLFFGYHFMPPFLTYHRVSADGRLVFSREIDVKGPTMIHDFAITRNHVIFMDLPVVFNLEKAMAGTAVPYEWSDGYVARLGVLPRNDEQASIQWFDIDPCYVFHVMNAFDSETGVVLDAVRYADMWRKDHNDFSSAYLTRWTLNLDTGGVSEEQLSDLSIEFPRTNDGVQGQPYRYGYAPIFDEGIQSHSMGEIAKFDLELGTSTPFSFGEPVCPGEFVFAPGQVASEDGGYLVGFAYRPSTDSSAFYVFDAQAPGSTPLARVELPQRVPFGFHGNWFADA